MKLTKIVNGRVNVVDERGKLLGPVFGQNAVSAFINDKGDRVVVTFLNGKVELFNDRGMPQRTIVYQDGVNARFAGEDIAVETNKGKIELRSQTGLLKKTL